MKIEINEEWMHRCFENAMRQLEIDVGLTLEKCVEKQIPKTPEFLTSYDYGSCPVCQGVNDSTNNYCWNCGQRLAWRNGRE